MDTYWRKLLEVCGAANVAARCRVVTPENAGRLPVSMSLTSKLLASPQAIRRIRMLCRGRQGYIVPGIVGEEEVGQRDVSNFGEHFWTQGAPSVTSHPEGGGSALSTEACEAKP